MTALLFDWASLLLRWAHLLAGIMWIGTSFYFIWLDSSLRKRDQDDQTLAGESWMVHGGGFYQVEKYLVAPEKLPEELHWFKYEAYLTWLTGFGLMAIIYYWGAEAFMINPKVMDLTPAQAIGLSIGSLVAGWVVYDLMCRSPISHQTGLLAAGVFVLIALASVGYTHVFSGRAAFIHIGAFIGTIMAANVFLVIIPNQKKVFADLVAGRTPDAKYGLQAKQRSLHNNYLTLPVLFMMISNHYPIAYSGSLGWLVAIGVVVAGGLIRHFFNQFDADKLDWSGRVALPMGVLAILALIVVTAGRVGGAGGGEKVAFTSVHGVIMTHCVSCHSASPANEDFEEAPGGVMFDSADDIRRRASQILAQTVLSDAMPLGNMTEMTEDERKLLADWVAQGAEID
ncbi:MAG: urate hydroxylase PuuD [Hyphomicrobiales bacterium]